MYNRNTRLLEYIFEKYKSLSTREKVVILYLYEQEIEERQFEMEDDPPYLGVPQMIWSPFFWNMADKGEDFADVLKGLINLKIIDMNKIHDERYFILTRKTFEEIRER